MEIKGFGFAAGGTRHMRTYVTVPKALFILEAR